MLMHNHTSCCTVRNTRIWERFFFEKLNNIAYILTLSMSLSLRHCPVYVGESSSLQHELENVLTAVTQERSNRVITLVAHVLNCHELKYNLYNWNHFITSILYSRYLHIILFFLSQILCTTSTWLLYWNDSSVVSNKASLKENLHEKHLKLFPLFCITDKNHWGLAYCFIIYYIKSWTRTVLVKACAPGFKRACKLKDK